MDGARMARAGDALLRWHERTERELPWRGESDPYRVWISETMLQQTRAAHAAGRYEAFCSRFPDVGSLARSCEEDVLCLWQGLGYYARARNLRKAAIRVAGEYGERFPDTQRELIALPGIGLYTARAILSMAFGQPVAAVDANLERVISRFFAMRGFLEDNREDIRALADAWLCACAKDRPGDFNRAMMGLGALVCLPRSPKCAECPLRGDCEAFSRGISAALPDKKPKSAKRMETLGLAVALRGGRVLVRKRPDTGMLAGLWEFPHFELSDAQIGPNAVAGRLLEEGFAVEPLLFEPVSTEFAFTHKIWKMRAWAYSLLSEGEISAPYRLVDMEALAALPMPSVMEPYRAMAVRLASE